MCRGSVQMLSLQDVLVSVLQKKLRGFHVLLNIKHISMFMTKIMRTVQYMSLMFMGVKSI